MDQKTEQARQRVQVVWGDLRRLMTLMTKPDPASRARARKTVEMAIDDLLAVQADMFPTKEGDNATEGS